MRSVGRRYPNKSVLPSFGCGMTVGVAHLTRSHWLVPTSLRRICSLLTFPPSSLLLLPTPLLSSSTLFPTLPHLELMMIVVMFLFLLMEVVFVVIVVWGFVFWWGGLPFLMNLLRYWNSNIFEWPVVCFGDFFFFFFFCFCFFVLLLFIFDFSNFSDFRFR